VLPSLAARVAISRRLRKRNRRHLAHVLARQICQYCKYIGRPKYTCGALGFFPCATCVGSHWCANGANLLPVTNIHAMGGKIRVFAQECFFSPATTCHVHWTTTFGLGSVDLGVARTLRVCHEPVITNPGLFPLVELMETPLHYAFSTLAGGSCQIDSSRFLMHFPTKLSTCRNFW